MWGVIQPINHCLGSTLDADIAESREFGRNGA
jgi:hypothetical protein